MQVGYVFKEAAVSLKRNFVMTVVGMMVVAVSLFLVGASLVLSQSVNKYSKSWQGLIELSIFMNSTASQTQIDAIGTTLQTMQGGTQDVASYRFVDKPEANEEFRRLFANNPALISSLKVEDMPTSFRVQPTKAELTQSVVDSFRNLPGVYDVRAPIDQIKNALEDGRTKKNIGLVIAVILFVSALMLIFVTTQLAILARRREVSVMKLVGATNWFIRVPFMLEGVAQGVVGSGMAFAAVFAVRNAVPKLISTEAADAYAKVTITPHEAVMTGIVLLIFGAAAGAISSFLATRRYLKV